jgi:hypothetical protein
MNTPIALVEWLSEKVESHEWASVREPRVVAHTWTRHTGGRIMSATLSVAIAPSPCFVVTVEAQNIEPEYVSAAKNGVLTVLLSQSWAPVLKCAVTLSDFQPHESQSSYAAFYAVAKEATEQLLGVAPGFTHNIAWS